MNEDFIDEELVMVVEDTDENDDLPMGDDEAILAILPLISHVVKTNSFDIGLPVCKLTRLVRKDIKGLKAYCRICIRMHRCTRWILVQVQMRM